MGLDLDCPSVRVLCAAPVPIVEFADIRDHRVRLRGRTVQRQRAFRCRSRGWKRLVRRPQPEDTRHHVRFGQTGPRIGVIRIALDRLAEVVDRPRNVLYGPLP